MSWFTSSPAATAPVTSYDVDPDSAYRAAWGLSLEEWHGLTDTERRNRRDRVVYAPNFQTVG